MTHAIIEHVNLTVSNSEQSAAMLVDIFGWRVRWRGQSAIGNHVFHVGNDTHYIALSSPPDTANAPFAFEKGEPLNHVGIVVDDLDAVERKALARGLKPYAHGDYEPGRRFYFFDGDGIEFEVVSYEGAAF